MNQSHPHPDVTETDDTRLRAFLQQYRPEPPASSPDLEEQLMQRLEVPATSIRQRPRLSRLAIPGAIAAGLLLTWGGSRLLVPQFGTAQLESRDELEAFLFDNWEGALQPSPAASGGWQVLTIDRPGSASEFESSFPIDASNSNLD